MFAKFEEKIYESYFNNELDSLSSIYFPLGQIQEGILGMDSVAYSNDPVLWRNIGFPSPNGSLGENFNVIAEEMENHLNSHVKNIPPLKVNLIFQYKRPEYMKTANATQWNLWKKKYYRYGIYEKQQELLSHIEHHFENKVLVLYASPAIHILNDLIDIKRKKKIIENSNFMKASELTGHHYNTYIRSGSHSIACSEPEKIEDFNLLDYLIRIASAEQSESTEEDVNSKFIQNFTKDIDVIFNDNKEYRIAYKLLLKDYSVLEDFPLLFGLIRMKIVHEISGIQWLIAY